VRQGGSFRSIAAACALVFAVAVALYAANHDHGFVFDDHTLVEENSRVHSIDVRAAFTTPYWGPERNDGLYRPATLLSFAADWRLGGGDPGWFHIVNDLLHGLVAALVVLVTWATLRSVFAGVAAGTLFAAHPVHAEAVHWIAGRAELLAALFVLSGLVLALVPRAIDARTDRLRSLLLVGAGFAAILSKEHGVTALPLALLAAWLFRTPGARPVTRNSALWLGALLALGGWLVLREAAVGDPTYATPAQDNPLVSRAGLDRAAGALAVGVRWIEHLLLPLTSSVDYGAPRSLAGGVPVWIAASVTALVLAALLGAALRLSHRRPAIAFWCAFLVVTYLPTSNLLFSTGTVFAERLLYLPSVAVCALFAAGLASVRKRPVAIALLAALASTYAALTLSCGADWRSDRTLFEREIAHPPYSARAAVNLATVVEDEDPPRADQLYREARTLAPDYIGLHLAYGTSLLKRGDAAGALPHLTRANELYPDSPSTLLNLGTAYARLGSLTEAARSWERLVAIDPGNVRARQNLEQLRRLTPSSSAAPGPGS